MTSPVCSHNEWDPLEEVIVGDGFPESMPLLDFSFQHFFHDNIFGEPIYSEDCHKFINKRHVAEHNEDIENFAELLASHNITVKRPKIPKKFINTKTLAWNSSNYPALNVRDLTMIVGDEIIEVSSSSRWRYFENDYLKHIFLDYFKRGARWTQSPKPIVTDNSFDMKYVYKTPGAKEHFDKLRSRHKHDLDCGIEIMYDAANCMRLGEHILFNASTDHDRLGATWLQRHLGDQYKVWVVEIADSHIDSIFLPVRPGLAIITDRDVVGKLPKPLQKWDFVYIPIINRSENDIKNQNIRLASPRIWINLLSIDPNTVICHTEYYDQLKMRLRKYNVDVIPSRIRHCEIFGGGHHCTTIDIRRKGCLVNYFDE